jgi:hypothetical protein
MSSNGEHQRSRCALPLVVYVDKNARYLFLLLDLSLVQRGGWIATALWLPSFNKILTGGLVGVDAVLLHQVLLDHCVNEVK